MSAGVGVLEYELRVGMVLTLDGQPWVRLLRRLNAASNAVETAWRGRDLTGGCEITVRVRRGARVTVSDR